MDLTNASNIELTIKEAATDAAITSLEHVANHPGDILVLLEKLRDTREEVRSEQAKRLGIDN